MERQSHDLELSLMRELKTKAELDSLHAKVNPHFLYNALNSIHTLIDQDPEKAKEMIHLLSRLFRLSISTSSEQFHTLKEELELVKTYLSIEKARFQERLKFEIICDDQLLGFMVPRFLLQPLVENAIKHGTSKLRDNGHVLVLVQKNWDFLEVQVRDNGPAFSEEFQNGHGLKSVRDKIRLLGAEGSEFEIVAGGDHVPPIAGPWKYVGIKFKRP
jgi:LytS/YehU family sensor histidine kinase